MRPVVLPKAPSHPARSEEASSGSFFRSGPDSGGAGEIALSEADLGSRISVLFRIHGDPEHQFSEVVGVVQGIERGEPPAQGILRVVRRNGDLVSVAFQDVVRFKILNGAPVRET